jgi:two-component system nitrogen regulation sensor histidine kinase NtrY
MRPQTWKTRLWLGFGGLLVVLLLAGVFTLGSLDLPFEPRHWNEVVALYALSTFIVAALLVFGLILTRSLLRLWAERRAAQLGARFKTKMVLGAMAISLLPVVFMFWVSYALLNRTLARWFPRPLEVAIEQSQKLLNELGTVEHTRLVKLAYEARMYSSMGAEEFVEHAAKAGADAAWILDKQGKVRAGGVSYEHQTDLRPGQAGITLVTGQMARALPSGIEVWEADGSYFLAARVPIYDVGEYLGAVIAGQRTTSEFQRHYTEIEAQTRAYGLEKQRLRTVKTQLLLALFLFTLLLLFAATWFALFLSKQVTVPIQALAEGTREVIAGNFDYRVQAQAQDELGILVRSFNDMTAQLGDSRRQIDEFTRSLQQAVQELDRRRKLMETILENIPTGVLSLDAAGTIVRINPAAEKIFGQRARTARALDELLSGEAARGVQQLMRRALRMGVASKELEVALPGRVLHAAVTVSSLGPRSANPGFVVVLVDLTELLRAQKAAAWQEVAQRIAHEIKNPLTPIQLSAQRLGRYLERQRASGAASGAGAAAQESELTRLVGECAGLIEREVATLESLVDEFSQFARFPTARLQPADSNAIVAEALEVFRGRLETITVRAALAAGLPAIKADPELLRRVLVNLIDNAAEAMEGSAAKELALSTRAGADGETVEIVVADSGHGISPEDKDKLFLPQFSTRERGTGLGLAIAARIIAEHHGTIRVEDNSPVGTRFVIQLPVAEVPAERMPSGS